MSQHCWLPEKYAKLKKVLQIRENGVWENGWIVVSVGETCRAENSLPDPHIEIKQHRKKTGDSLPKNKVVKQ